MNDFVKDIVFNVDVKSKEAINGLKSISNMAGEIQNTANNTITLFEGLSEELQKQVQARLDYEATEQKIAFLSKIHTKEATEQVEIYRKQNKEREKMLGMVKEEKKQRTSSWGEQFETGFKKEIASSTSSIPTSGAEWGSLAASKLVEGLEVAWKKLKEVLSESWQELGNMLNFSRLTQSQTRELAFGYGLNASQAYGMSQAMSLTGISSIEDLAYANPTERRLFTDAFKKYTEKYNELADSGFFDSMLEYQVEMEEFKQDLKLEVVEFFMENKDLIKTGMKAIMTLAKGALEALSTIIKILNYHYGERSDAEKAQAASDIVGSYTNNRTVNVKMDYSFTNTTAADRQAILNSMQQPLNGMVAALNAE